MIFQHHKFVGIFMSERLMECVSIIYDLYRGIYKGNRILLLQEIHPIRGKSSARRKCLTYKQYQHCLFLITFALNIFFLVD